MLKQLSVFFDFDPYDTHLELRYFRDGSLGVTVQRDGECKEVYLSYDATRILLDDLIEVIGEKTNGGTL
jgi:hypothetical protein